MLRCDSARMGTSVTAPFGKITWLVSRTWPWPAATAAADSEVSRATSVTGDDRVSLASTAYSSFGVSASARRSSANLLAASMPGMMWEDTVRSADQRDQPDGQVPPAAGEHIEDTTYMDIDAVVADVASAVGLAARRIRMLGDDDLISVAIAAFAAALGLQAGIERLAVIDSDPEVLAWAGEQIAGTGVAAELIEHDLRRPLPAGLAGGFDVACTDPPYTVAGAELFLSRAVAVLAHDPGRHVVFSFGARMPDETLRTQELFGSMGLTVRGLWPGFNEYLGAGILAGTSHLYHLRSTAAAKPLIDGEFSGPMYTAEARSSATRPYRCAGCRAVHQVGPGGRWPGIAALQAAGCPQCGGATFRPLPLRHR